ncbi:saccharopine dehydrogenase family protein [Planctobacterium marinum]|uniref:saccharopine dehydrogenase family protein n=1 Tax=Planctobacterium marinum TaxID=1631968 RepID=UPI001E3C15CD|nr:saccharopine dehydrogenase NADP-binding domain-containing protein [Planctobacterium marinum]MCC2607374.1 saccharopine dehydrogenase NADP-binding domain-containing protein [Planctobacterium marinum]
MSDTPFDFVIFGASSFVGKILCRYLAENYQDSDIRWAIAGRSAQKLEQLKSQLGDNAKTIPTILADAADEAQLSAMVSQTRLVVSTVGPYALYGEPLVKVCSESGTDYCDLTGETQWIARMVEKYHEKAKASSARIVHCCGFDSIPSDMGVLFLQEAAKQQFGHYCYRVKMRVKAMKGGFSGGTVASLLNVAKEAASDPALRRTLTNPYALCPADHPFFARQASNNKAKYDNDFKQWTAPFVMASINTRIVHRSNALLNARYGKNFLYDEAMLSPSAFKAKALTYGLGAFMVSAAISPLRAAMESLFLPKPGDGPTPDEQENGYFNMHFFGETATGKSIRCKVTGDKDPGYGSTAKMLAETAIFFSELNKASEDASTGGFWTPSTLFGMPLIERLKEKAGLTFEQLND